MVAGDVICRQQRTTAPIYDRRPRCDGAEKTSTTAASAEAGNLYNIRVWRSCRQWTRFQQAEQPLGAA